MFLPGMNYQDNAWELTKKALGLAALEAIRAIGVARLIDDAHFTRNLSRFRVKMSSVLLRMQGHLERTRNGHDRDAFELASDLVLALTPSARDIDTNTAFHRRLEAMRPALLRFAQLQSGDGGLAEDALQDVLIGVLEQPERFAGLSASSIYGMIKCKLSSARDPADGALDGPNQERPKYFSILIGKIEDACGENSPPDTPDSVLRQIANEVFADLRDEVDVQGFRAETGEAMSVNRLRNIRKVDEASNTVKAMLANWTAHKQYVGLILGYEVMAEPIEHRHLLNGGRCKAEWLLRWSEHFGRFNRVGKNGKPSKAADSQPAMGKFHNRSKQFTATVDNIEEFLKLLDPLMGRYHPVLGGRQSPSDLQAILEDIEADVVDDAQHASRVLASDGQADTAEPERELADDEQEPAQLDALAMAYVDVDADADADAWDAAEEPDPFEAPPGNGRVSAEGGGDGDEADAESDVSYLQELRLRLQHYALPIQVGVLRDLSVKCDGDDLLDAIEYMGVFDAWGLERDVNLLTNVELARRLPKKLNGNSVSPGTVKNWIAKAQEELCAFASAIRQGAGDTGKNGE